MRVCDCRGRDAPPSTELRALSVIETARNDRRGQAPSVVGGKRTRRRLSYGGFQWCGRQI